MVMEYFHQIIFETPLTAFLLKIGESMNITSKVAPVNNILNDKLVKRDIIFFFMCCNSF